MVQKTCIWYVVDFFPITYSMCIKLCIDANHRQDQVVPFFQFLENNSNIAEKVFDSSISQTTLEEVFLNVSSCYNMVILMEKMFAFMAIRVSLCYKVNN